MWTPERDSRSRNQNHCPHPLGLCVESRLFEQATYEQRRLVLLDRQVNQAILGMTQLTVKEASIAREKRKAALVLQERDDLIILLHSAPSRVDANLPDVETPLLQQ